jgi:hypothetical protein
MKAGAIWLRSFPFLLAASHGLLPGVAAAQAQCAGFDSGASILGVNGAVQAMTVWDRDGAGPLPPLWVFGGEFTVAGNVAANCVATFDPATETWGALGSGMTNPLWGPPSVRALAVLPNGDLIAGGTFAETGGQWAADGVARWDGTTWHRLGLGIPGGVTALAALPNGELIVGCTTTITGTSLTGIARWDGSSWSALGSAPPGSASTMLVLPNGDLLAAMRTALTTWPYTQSVQVHRWNGSAWSALGPAFPGSVTSLVVRPDGSLVLSGGLSFGPISYGAMWWNGSNWAPLGQSQGLYVPRLANLQNGDLLASGPSMLRWDGAAWTPFAPAISADLFLVAANGEVVAQGASASASGLVRSQNGAPWRHVGQGHSGSLSEVAVMPNGDVVVAGIFEMQPSGARNLARWNGASWSAFGTAAPTQIRALCARHNGNLVVSADFTASLGAGCYLAEWNGSAWSPIGAPIWNGITALGELPNGDLLAGPFWIGPTSELRRWTGSAFVSFALPLSQPPVDVLVLRDGSLVVRCNGPVNGDYVQRWNGTAWQSAGHPSLSWNLRRLRELDDGTLAAANGYQVWRQVSGTWQQVGPSHLREVEDVVGLPNGDLLVALGYATTGGSALRRWDNTAWTDVGPVTTSGGFGSNTVRLVVPRAGEVRLVGTVGRAAGQPANGFIRLRSLCPAASDGLGQGCAASGPAATLTTLALPWLGAAFRARADNLPAALAVVVTGFGQVNVPLASLLPPSPAACALRVTPDAIELSAVVGGSFETALALPNVAALLGAVAYRQVVAIELDAASQPVRSIATNALTLTVGAF